VADALYRLVYRSDSNIPHGDSPALQRIFDVSCRNNQRDRITGALALPDGKFVQAIEGPRGLLKNLMLRLRHDDRHSGIELLGEWPITARLFPGWAMAHPNPTPLSEQSFRIITEKGSGAQCTGILLALMQEPGSILCHAPTI
jgi:hypothetical protein